MYVDDLVTGGANLEEVEHVKTQLTMFKEGGFNLHKWHSNVSTLETDKLEDQFTEQNYAKQQLGTKPRKKIINPNISLLSKYHLVWTN